MGKLVSARVWHGARERGRKCVKEQGIDSERENCLAADWGVEMDVFGNSVLTEAQRRCNMREEREAGREREAERDREQQRKRETEREFSFNQWSLFDQFDHCGLVFIIW